NVKDADTLEFAEFWQAYEEQVRKVRENRVTPEDFTGTTISITNPGTVGTVQSVPRLMAGQAAIVGVGAVQYPAEFQGADLDPLSSEPRAIHPELDPHTFGFTIWDLDREFITGGLAGRRVRPLFDILAILRDAYCRSHAPEYMHIQEPDQKAWIQEHVEGVDTTLPKEDHLHVLRRLKEAEALEK